MERARQLFTAGLAKHVEKDYPQAEKLYREALDLMPGRPSLLFNLGRLMLDQRRFAEAEPLFAQAAAQAPDPESWFNLGLARAELQRFGDAIQAYDHALEASPNMAEAHAARAWALERGGRIEQALHGHARSVELASDNPEYQVSFTRCAGQLGEALEIADAPLLEAATLICLRGANVDYQLLQGVVLALLGRRFKRWRAQMEEAGFDWNRLEREAPKELRAFCNDWLLIAALERIALTNHANEASFTRLRASLLRLTMIGPRSAALTETVTPLALFLGCQCFINEYVWDQTPDETAMAEKLVLRVQAAIATETLSDLELGMLACYKPLHASRLVTMWGQSPLAAGNPARQALLRMQVREPVQEAAIAPQVPQLKPVADATSLAVQAQYEENPYPRWLALAWAAPISYLEQVARDIAPAPLSPGKEARQPDILIAGCGTGRHAFSYARTFAGARITAIDLSLASLAYATRKGQELRIANVRLLNGDLLDLDALAQQFDVISSVGVLHHMADPEAGLKSLLRRLKPDGYLQIGLYSEHARRDIVRIREEIARQGLPATPEGIRACRAWVREHSSYAKLMIQAEDFYSTSMVRDLLFHVQEKRYTIPQIADMLARHKLEFLGFSSTPAKALYHRAYPEDEAMQDLETWGALELEHPDMFRGMYQFWARPRA